MTQESKLLERMLIEEISEKLEPLITVFTQLGEDVAFEFATAKIEDGLPGSLDTYKKLVPLFNDLVREVNNQKSIL